MKVGELTSDERWAKRIGEGFRNARRRRSVTQGSLAVAVDVDISTISNTELGKTSPTYALVEAVAETLSVSIDELVGRKTALDGAVRINLPDGIVHVSLLAESVSDDRALSSDQLESIQNRVLGSLSAEFRDLSISHLTGSSITAIRPVAATSAAITEERLQEELRQMRLDYRAEILKLLKETLPLEPVLRQALQVPKSEPGSRKTPKKSGRS